MLKIAHTSFSKGSFHINEGQSEWPHGPLYVEHWAAKLQMSYKTFLFLFSDFEKFSHDVGQHKCMYL